MPPPPPSQTHRHVSAWLKRLPPTMIQLVIREGIDTRNDPLAELPCEPEVREELAREVTDLLLEACTAADRPTSYTLVASDLAEKPQCLRYTVKVRPNLTDGSDALSGAEAWSGPATIRLLCGHIHHLTKQLVDTNRDTHASLQSVLAFTQQQLAVEQKRANGATFAARQFQEVSEDAISKVELLEKKLKEDSDDHDLIVALLTKHLGLDTLALKKAAKEVPGPKNPTPNASNGSNGHGG